MTDSTMPRIYFRKVLGSSWTDKTLKIIDHHGVDVTSLFRVHMAGFQLNFSGKKVKDGIVVHGLAEATLSFASKGWVVECPSGKTEEAKINSVKFHDNLAPYDLMNGLQPNTLSQTYPRDSSALIHITFDAEWDDSLGDSDD